MAVYFGNQKAKQLVYVDANGVQHNIKEAYLGSQLVFSGKKGFTVVTKDRWGEFNWHKNGYNGSTTLQTSNVTINQPTFIEVDYEVTNMTAMFGGRDATGDSDLLSIELDFDTSNVTDMHSLFFKDTNLSSVVFKKIDTAKVTDFNQMFCYCQSLVSLDLSKFITLNVTKTFNMFINCTKLASIDLSNFDMSKVTTSDNMFKGCNALTHIKCKQAFKNWCWTNATTIELPAAMQNGGSGTWEIVG